MKLAAGFLLMLLEGERLRLAGWKLLWSETMGGSFLGLPYAPEGPCPLSSFLMGSETAVSGWLSWT